MPPRHLRKPVPSPTVRRLRGVAMLAPAVTAAIATATSMLTPTAGHGYLARGSATVLDAAAPPVVERPRDGQVGSRATVRPRPVAPAAPAAPAEKVLPFDFQLQTTYYYCGPTAAHMALSARGVHLSQDDLAARLGTTTFGTASAVDTTRVLNAVLNTSFYRTHSIPGPGATPAQIAGLRADVVRAISNGYGVVANIAGGATDLAGVWHDFPGGHYVAIVGYKDNGASVEIADSSGMFGPGTYWMSTANAARWMATHGYSA